jgi:hypothetical protein
MFGLTSWLKIGLGALAGASLAFAAGYLNGRSDGKESVLADLKDDRITILEDGKKIDAEALTADDPGLCALLGGCELPDGGTD